MTSSPKIHPLTSPSHYSNRAREKRCTRAKEVLCELIKSQTTHDVDPKDVKTTKPSSGVSWRFIVEPGTEFPYVQLSSISRPNLDLLEKAVEGGGVKVIWLNDSDGDRNGSADDGSFSESRRPRKRTKHSSEPSQTSNEPTSPAPPIQGNSQPKPLNTPITTFTTVNEAPKSIVQSQSAPAPSPPISSATEDESRSSPTVSVEIPLSVISKALAAERNSSFDKLKQENNRLIDENRRLQAEVAMIQAKYNELEEKMRRKMSQIEEILGGSSTMAKES